MAKPPAPPPSRGPPAYSGERRGSNFSQGLGNNERAERDAAMSNHPSETEEKWVMGSKFKHAPPERENSGPSFGRKFNNGRPGFGERGPSGGDSGHGSPTPVTPALSDDNSDWRSGPRKVPPSGPASRQGSQESPGKAVAMLFPSCLTDISSGAGGPPLRRKIELLPRSNNPSAVPSPLASPKDGAAAKPSAPKANPFGDAR
jgi:translation initiation factor 4B